jgi:hypothetical protein
MEIWMLTSAWWALDAVKKRISFFPVFSFNSGEKTGVIAVISGR